MNIPEQINILGLTYTIKDYEPIDFGERIYGLIDNNEQTITLDKTMSQEKREQVFIHEFVHGALWQLQQNEHADDEVLVQGLAIAIHQLVKSLT